MTERSSNLKAGAEAVAQLAKCLLCKDEDQGSRLRSHVIKASEQTNKHPIISRLGRQGLFPEAYWAVGIAQSMGSRLMRSPVSKKKAKVGSI